ncbi:MAG: DcaP family trimeric outer membrane transporter, partial [Pirellulaceae bacterium]
IALTSHQEEEEAADDVEDLFRPDTSAANDVLFEGQSDRLAVGTDFYTTNDDFLQGIVISGPDVSMKISGYVKADLIHDFNPIESTDTFDTTTIPVDDDPHQNSRFHARQSRLSFDTRWPSDWGPVRVFVETDFFSDGDRLRLRHAYGELRALIVGQTWTTFTDVKALPNTLDFEGAVSGVSRRQGQVRWTQPVIPDVVTIALAVEDSQTLFAKPSAVDGEARKETPDIVARLRYSPEWGQFQVAAVLRELGFQPTGSRVEKEIAGGWNFTGAVYATGRDKVYYQILYGRGIGSYRGLPDAAPTGVDSMALLNTFGWMIGWTHDWNNQLSSNFTYSESRISNTSFQLADDLHSNSYLALNLVWNPIERMFVGIEYLFGARENVDRSRGEANRVQASFGFYLP